MCNGDEPAIKSIMKASIDNYFAMLEAYSNDVERKHKALKEIS